MRKKWVKGVVIGALFSLVVVLGYFGGRVFLFNKIKAALLVKADSLRNSGFELNYDSLQYNAWSNTMTMSALCVKRSSGDSCRMHLDVGLIQVHGVAILPLLFKRKLVIDRVTVRNPVIIYSKKFEASNKSRNEQQKINGVYIGKLTLESASIQKRDSSSCHEIMKAGFDFELNGFELWFSGQGAQEWKAESSGISNLRILLPEKFYSITIKKIGYTSSLGKIIIDSILVRPDFDKFTFARKTGIQTDRIDCRIPRAEAIGFKLKFSEPKEIQIKSVNLTMEMNVFRDKRYPFVKKETRILPVDFMHELPYIINVDSIDLSDSHVTYSEFAEGGEEPGIVSFDYLNAKLSHISNNSTEKTVLKAHCRFMNAGNLEARFTFPADPKMAYFATGSLTDFSLPAINPMLSPIAQGQIKSGMLKRLAFDFEYNSYRSDGKVSLQYHDLNVISLLKKSKEAKANKLATLVLSSFVFKKDMDQEKGDGTILFYRDQHRAIFNYWWKSLLSGIKSVFNLDRITKTNRNKK